MCKASIAMCKRNGWGVGTRLVGDEGFGPTVIEITAMGRDTLLAIQVSHNGKKTPNAWETSWTLLHRDWKTV